MVIPQEIVTLVGDLVRRVDLLVAFTDVDGKKQAIATLEQKISEAKFWNNPDEAREIMQQLSALKGAIEVVITLRNKILELDSFMALLREEDDESLLVDFKKDVNKLSQELDNREITLFLSGKHDRCNAILTIHTGAGGTESCDWADMLLRMYLHWTECRGFGVEIQDIQPGEEAGISRATIRITGQNAYGYAKSERGVHRLVRISPFDANKRRHTSFCAVDVIAEIEDDDEIEIRDDEIRIDTYRSSGKGGQHVNKTESAIRITHLPTGIVVTCQNERSQYKNKDFAMKTLRSRLREKMEDEKRSEMEKFYGEKGEMGWGYQIRSYVLQPYQMVKDLRTGIENGDVMSVLNGDIDFFINGWLRAGCPKARQRHTRLNK